MYKHSLIVVTVADMAEEVISRITEESYDKFIVSGIVLLDQDWTGRSVKGVPVVSNEKNVKEYVCHEWVDEVLIRIPDSMEYPESLIDAFHMMGVTVHFSSPKVENGKGEIQKTEYIGGYQVLTTSIARASTIQLACKRLMDIAGGIIGCLFTIILVIFLAPAIYIQSPGPVFFSQTRIGQNGRKFKIYKFRSMYMDAEKRKEEFMEKNKISGSPLMFKMDHDPRIIGSGKLDRHGRPGGIGNFIRRTSLDEFPQFWNVLKGQMSLVGTRPPTVDEWEKYDLHHRKRMAIKPGITGMWQVSGRNDITDFDEVVRLDTKYIKNWSIGLDCKIILKTFGVIFSRNGL